MPTTEPGPAARDINRPHPEPSDPHKADSRMMWAAMIGCCLAIPLAVIVGGASLGSLAGASPTLIGVAVVLVVALVVTRRTSSVGRCDDRSNRG